MVKTIVLSFLILVGGESLPCLQSVLVDRRWCVFVGLVQLLEPRLPPGGLKSPFVLVPSLPAPLLALSSSWHAQELFMIMRSLGVPRVFLPSVDWTCFLTR